jgi:MOSC domain-containing protein YiiM
MVKGTLVSIYITASAGQPMMEVSQAQAIPGHGLDGDRYAAGLGLYSATPGTGRQLTLIEQEAIQAFNEEEGFSFTAAELRRNLVTQGVPLNHLVGKEFQVGAVTLRGVRLCEPCDYLAGLTRPEVLPGLVHRGGLRVDILTSGMLHAGDQIEWE